MIDAGKMTERVTFQAKSVTRNSLGEEVVTWGDVATVWAEVHPSRGREFNAANQTQQVVVPAPISARWKSWPRMDCVMVCRLAMAICRRYLDRSCYKTDH